MFLSFQTVHKTGIVREAMAFLLGIPKPVLFAHHSLTGASRCQVEGSIKTQLVDDQSRQPIGEAALEEKVSPCFLPPPTERAMTTVLPPTLIQSIRHSNPVL